MSRPARSTGPATSPPQTRPNGRGAQETLRPPAEEDPRPPAEDNPRPPAEDNPRPPAEEDPRPPAEEDPRPPAEDNLKPGAVDDLKPDPDEDLTADADKDWPATLQMPKLVLDGTESAKPPVPRKNRSRRTWLSRAVLLAILCAQAVLSLRLHNTVFEDEALYLSAGHLELNHWLHSAVLQGSYVTSFPGAPGLYPVLGAAVDSLGGLVAARAVSLIEMLSTTTLLYAMTRRLFNERVGLCAAALFSVTEGTIFLGHLASNDASSVSLLALASWIVVRTASWRWRAYLLAAPVACLAAATSYWALLYLPTIAVLAGLAAHPYQGRKALVRSLVLWAVTVELLAGALVVVGKVYVTGVVSTMAARSPGGTQVLRILADSGRWGGLAIAMAMLGAVGYAIRARTEPNERIAPPGDRRRRMALGIALAGTALLAPAYQLYLNSDVSLERHIGYGLFFAAPMAGVGLARLVGDHFRRAQFGIAVWAVALTLGLGQSGQLFGSWPDSTALVGELTRYLRPGDHYLVENAYVPIYYLMGHPDARADQFTSTFFISYRTSSGRILTGTQGFLAAVRGGRFGVIAYDNTVTPALDKSLAAALESDPRYRFVAAVPENAPDIHTTCYIWVRT